MITFLPKIMSLVGHETRPPLYQQKLVKIDESFENLKEIAREVSQQAIEVTDGLKRNVELFDKRFKAIIDEVDDVIIVKTIDHKWVSINDFTCKLFAIDKEVCLGKTNREISEMYPQLEDIIKALDYAENNVWTNKRKATIQLSIEGVKNRKSPIVLDVVVSPVETDDKLAQEIVLVGRKEKRSRTRKKDITNVENV